MNWASACFLLSPFGRLLLGGFGIHRAPQDGRLLPVGTAGVGVDGGQVEGVCILTAAGQDIATGGRLGSFQHLAEHILAKQDRQSRTPFGSSTGQRVFQVPAADRSHKRQDPEGQMWPNRRLKALGQLG